MTEQNPAIDPVNVVPPNADFSIRRTTEADKPWIRRLLRQYWASERIISRGRLHDVVDYEGFAAFRDDEPIGLIMFLIEGDQCEIIVHNSTADSGGIGSCLLAAARNEARDRGCHRLWLVTTNDNTPAIRFYQRRDFDICAFHRNAITESRKLKPEVPDEGLFGIRVRHEIELEYLL